MDDIIDLDKLNIPESQDDWVRRMALEVLKVSRSELYMDFRFLDMALSALALNPWEGVQGMGTDGARLLAQPDRLLRLTRRNPTLINREYLHVVLHCVFRHPFMIMDHDPALWDLACDIAVESVIDSLDKKSVRRIQTLLRRRTYAELKELCPTLAAEPIYRVLASGKYDHSQLTKLQRDFRTEDHRFWPTPDQQNQPQIQTMSNQWQKISERMQTDMETHNKDAGDGEDDPLTMQVKAANRSRRTYKDFLRKFAVLREELHADPDTFDLNFYTYGLQLYGNMPLIEPMESRETKKIEEFVIVIDTSLSCSGELVKNFLQETYTLLKQTDSFFRRTNIRILQCDDGVRSDKKITSEEELSKYMFSFQLAGGGGTDFRPAFQYVEDLINAGEFTHLKGLLYFTDGLGRFPAKRPNYDAAFLFLGDQYEDADLPPWAMKLVLDEAEFMKKEKQQDMPALQDALALMDEEMMDDMPIL